LSLQVVPIQVHEGGGIFAIARIVGPLLSVRYAKLMNELKQLAEVMGKTIDACEGVTV